MRCQAWIVVTRKTVYNGSKVQRKPRTRIQIVGHRYAWRDGIVQQPAPPVHDAEICEGEIVVTVRVENEPVMGGTEAQLTVRAVCARCRNNYHGFIVPKTEEELSLILTQYVANL